MRTPEEKKAIKRAWYQRNKVEENRRARERAKALRARRRSLISCNCFACDDPDDTVIQWHHVDEEEKLFEIFGGHGNTAAENRWWNEVLKCIPLCANCHIKIHKEKLCLIPLPQLIQWAKLRISRTEFKPQPDTDNTCVPEFTCQASQQCCRQLNPRNLNKDSGNGKNETQGRSKKQAPGVLPFTSAAKTI